MDADSHVGHTKIRIILHVRSCGDSNSECPVSLEESLHLCNSQHKEITMLQRLFDALDLEMGRPAPVRILHHLGVLLSPRQQILTSSSL
jgi:hypothetical protein